MVITNIFLEDFKDMAFNWALCTSFCLLHYVDDTFVTWLTGSQGILETHPH
jgi:hypothetical protein